MTFVYLICFLLLAVGAVLLLKLTPERITGDLMRFVSPKQTLRDKVLTRKGKKKSRKITVELRRIKDALEQTGKGNQFAVACAASLLLMIVGCVIAIMIDNPFLVPVFAIAFAMIPFIYAKRTVAYYDNHVKEELETALSIITTSYVRTDDIVSAVKENIQYLKPPVKDIFAGFVAENMMISSDVKQSIRHLKEKVNNSIFAEWCETLIASQNIEDFLLPDVKELTKPLFSIPTHQFLFNGGNINAKDYIDALQLEESEFDLIKYPERGTCLFKCGNERYLLQVKAPEYKSKLFGDAGGK